MSQTQCVSQAWLLLPTNSGGKKPMWKIWRVTGYLILITVMPFSVIFEVWLHIFLTNFFFLILGFTEEIAKVVQSSHVPYTKFLLLSSFVTTNESTLIHNNWTSLGLFYLVSFLSSSGLSWRHYISQQVSLVSSRLRFSDFPCFSWSWQFLVPVFCRMSLNWELPDVSPTTKLGL